jgi:glutamyl-tRNA reductase
MSIVLVGLNHKTAPIEVRERFALDREACASGLQRLVDREAVREALIISTCNRVEVLAATEQSENSIRRVKEFFSECHALSPELCDEYFYVYDGEQAVRHLFRVASSLDSMVVGEPQILGQVRQAYALAVREGTAGRVLHRLVHHAFRVAKRVRTETGVADAAVSISYTAVELGRKIFGSLRGRTVLLIGAGEMAEIAARHLMNAGASRLLIANRTQSAGRVLAERYKAEAIDFAHLHNGLVAADTVICSTGGCDFIVTPEMVSRAMRERPHKTPLFLIDISVPRNIDPQVSLLPDVSVFDIDDLGRIAEENLRQREMESFRAEAIIDAEVESFKQALSDLDIGPTVGALHAKLERIARDELERRRQNLGQLSPEQEQAIEKLLLSVVKKISHPVIHRLRRSYHTGQAENVQAWRDIFGLED